MKKFYLPALLIISINGVAHGETFFKDSFESGNLNYIDPKSNAKWNGNSFESGDSIAVTSEKSRTGSKSLKFFFKGNSSLDDDASAEQRFNLGSNKNEVFIRYYIYFPSNYNIRTANGPSNNKWLRLWGDDYNNPIKVGMSIDSAMKPFFEGNIINWDGTYGCSGATGAGLNQESYKLNFTLNESYKERWVCFEFHIKRDSGIGDGILRMYVDGVLVNDNKNISWQGAPCSPGYFLNGYLMGWSNSGFNQDTAVYIDDVVFSTTYIGPDANTLPPPSAIAPSPLNLIISPK
jgi:hypothetical protein